MSIVQRGWICTMRTCVNIIPRICLRNCGHSSGPELAIEQHSTAASTAEVDTGMTSSDESASRWSQPSARSNTTMLFTSTASVSVICCHRTEILLFAFDKFSKHLLVVFVSPYFRNILKSQSVLFVSQYYKHRIQYPKCPPFTSTQANLN